MPKTPTMQPWHALLDDSESTVVRNDFRLEGAERILVVTGPNQGGKSTFARMVGRLMYPAALGCPVLGSRAGIMLPDRMATHLVREDEVDEQDGALGQELVRMRAILDHLTAHSVVILNESFSTTAAAGAVRVGGDVLHRIVERGSVSVYVTFLDELAEVGPEVVGMVAGSKKTMPCAHSESNDVSPTIWRTPR